MQGPPKAGPKALSNAQSHYDIPILFHAIGTNIRMLAKEELKRVPIFGRALQESGFIFIDRKNRQAAFDSLQCARESLKAGRHIWREAIETGRG